jgi:hypothetical protein
MPNLIPLHSPQIPAVFVYCAHFAVTFIVPCGQKYSLNPPRQRCAVLAATVQGKQSFPALHRLHAFGRIVPGIGGKKLKRRN